MLSYKELGVSLTDLRMVLDRLRRIYEYRSKVIEFTITGEPIVSPYPVLKVCGRVVRGYTISESRLRSIEPIPHRKRVLTADASMKTLFDLGNMKIVVAKVALGVWRGVSRIYTSQPLRRLAIVSTRQEAAEWLLRIELEAIMGNMHRIGVNDYCILDRGLMAVPAFRSSTRMLFEKLDVMAYRRGAILVGISKSSQISLNTGESLIGYLIRFASKRLPYTPWYYYPVFRSSNMPPWYIGEISVAKFDGWSENAFRVDISKNSLKSRYVETIMGEIAYMQDPGTPGYPYPVKGVHRESKISRDELEVLRMSFLEVLREEKLYDKFTSDLGTASFREKYL
ncbi:MAG: hypothetical protein B6U94_06410 [Thermofilum sp. ex4484_79]|nr:MAG: hypothetical protein B6U94_06410 [Thermofilum sp. ex4484_79]